MITTKYCTEDFLIPSKHDNRKCAEEVVWLGQIFLSPLAFFFTQQILYYPFSLSHPMSQQEMCINSNAIN
jgi:hypothetical protein